MEYELIFDKIYFFYMVVIFLFVYTLAICISKFGKKQQLMGFNYTQSLKGLMALLILFHHFSLRIENLGPMKVLSLIGLPTVSVFLFISGFVETIQLKKKRENYLKNYIFRKVGRIYIPWVISTLFFVLILRLKTVSTIFEGVFLFKTLYRTNTYNWFIIYLIYYYTINYLILTILKQNIHEMAYVKIHCITIIISSIFWIIGCIWIGKPINWYFNAMTPAFGMIFGYYYEDISERIKLESISSFVINVISLAISFCVFNVISIIWAKYIVYLIVIMNISIFVCQFSIFCNFYSAFFYFYGKISLEIFLYGTGVFLVYYYYCTPSSYGIVIIVSLITLISYFTNKVSSMLVDRVMRGFKCN